MANNRIGTPVQLPYYFAAVVSVATCLLIVCLLTGIGWGRSLVVGIGALVLIWGIVFTILEVRRNAGLTRCERTPEEREAFRNPHRPVVVQPPTGEAIVHHQNYPESPGRDQGQLTSDLPVSTPFVDRLLHADRLGKQKQ